LTEFRRKLICQELYQKLYRNSLRYDKALSYHNVMDVIKDLFNVV